MLALGGPLHRRTLRRAALVIGAAFPGTYAALAGDVALAVIFAALDAAALAAIVLAERGREQ